MARSDHLMPYQRALALTATGFMLNANGDQARAQTLFEQSLPLYRRSRGKLRIVLTALGLGILGQLAARRRDYSRASELIEFTVGCSEEASLALARALSGAVRRVRYGEPAPMYRDPG